MSMQPRETKTSVFDKYKLERRPKEKPLPGYVLDEKRETKVPAGAIHANASKEPKGKPHRKNTAVLKAQHQAEVEKYAAQGRVYIEEKTGDYVQARVEKKHGKTAGKIARKIGKPVGWLAHKAGLYAVEKVVGKFGHKVKGLTA